MDVSLEQIKKLREETSARVLHCREALEEAGGNFEEAKKILRKKAAEIAEKKSEKETTSGKITSYVHHNGKVGALVEIHCQSDFVARNADFQEFSKNIAMHIVAFDPQWNSCEDVPAEVIEEKKGTFRTQAEEGEKPSNILDKIIEGRIKKFYTQICLLEQPFLKDEKKTVGEYLKEFMAKVGENIKIHRFIRYELEKMGKEG